LLNDSLRFNVKEGIELLCSILGKVVTSTLFIKVFWSSVKRAAININKHTSLSESLFLTYLNVFLCLFGRWSSELKISYLENRIDQFFLYYISITIQDKNSYKLMIIHHFKILFFCAANFHQFVIYRKYVLLLIFEQ
jgi:hypothetical protein